MRGRRGSRFSGGTRSCARWSPEPGGFFQPPGDQSIKEGTMTPFAILALQSTLSLVAFALIARWYVAPRLSRASLEDYLVPLIWVHVFRYAPLTLLVPGQISLKVPAGVAATIAYGDLVSAIAALA